MLTPPLQPCPACRQKSVHLCEGGKPLPILAAQKQFLEEKESLRVGGGHLSGDKTEVGCWRPGRFLLYFCTACQFARLSISGLLRGEPSPGQSIHTAGRQGEGSCRVLLLHNDVQLYDEGGLAGAIDDSRIGDSRNGDSQNGYSQTVEGKGWTWYPTPERSLVQRSLSPTISVSEDLPVEENYGPAEWTYFFGDAEVCREVFQKQLDRVYARCRETGSKVA